MRRDRVPSRCRAARRSPTDRLKSKEVEPNGEEENRIGDLLRPPLSLHGNESLQHGLQRLALTLGLHLVAHRRTDHAGTDVIHADAAGRILESCGLREGDDPMFGSPDGGTVSW
jgi:hypothetical protein